MLRSPCEWISWHTVDLPAMVPGTDCPWRASSSSLTPLIVFLSQTPVWFAEEEGVLYVYTLANAGKVKHIRRHPRIRLAPCTMRGQVIGPWVEAEATIVDATTAAHGHALLRQKYGWLKGIGDLFSYLLHRERVVIAIRGLA